MILLCHAVLHLVKSCYNFNPLQAKLFFVNFDSLVQIHLYKISCLWSLKSIQ
jgi:hypothetical protein